VSGRTHNCAFTHGQLRKSNNKKGSRFLFYCFFICYPGGMTAHNMANLVLVNSVGGTHNGMSIQLSMRRSIQREEKRKWCFLFWLVHIHSFCSCLWWWMWTSHMPSSFVLYTFSSLICLLALVFFFSLILLHVFFSSFFLILV